MRRRTFPRRRYATLRRDQLGLNLPAMKLSLGQNNRGLRGLPYARCFFRVSSGRLGDLEGAARLLDGPFRVPRVVPRRQPLETGP